jgi:hypothetical protein
MYTKKEHDILENWSPWKTRIQRRRIIVAHQKATPPKPPANSSFHGGSWSTREPFFGNKFSSKWAHHIFIDSFVHTIENCEIANMTWKRNEMQKRSVLWVSSNVESTHIFRNMHCWREYHVREWERYLEMVREYHTFWWLLSHNQKHSDIEHDQDLAFVPPEEKNKRGPQTNNPNPKQNVIVNSTVILSFVRKENSCVYVYLWMRMWIIILVLVFAIVFWTSQRDSQRFPLPLKRDLVNTSVCV